MELWYTEEHTENVRFSLKIKKHVFQAQSQYQKLDIIDTIEYGRMLLLDGLVMVSDKDETGYHEMIAHIPAFTHPHPQTALVIGGGDGGTVRELLKHPSIQKIDLVEIDRIVTEACVEYMPNISCGLKDTRVSVFFEDGIEWVKNKENYYDIILVDSIDPMGPAVGLFQKPFYRDVFKCLTPEGIIAAQGEPPIYKGFVAGDMVRILKEFFPVATAYQSFIPTYPSGHWLFVIASKKYHPASQFRLEDARKMEKDLHFYNAALHQGAFALPTWVKNLLD